MKLWVDPYVVVPLDIAEIHWFIVAEVSVLITPNAPAISRVETEIVLIHVKERVALMLSAQFEITFLFVVVLPDTEVIHLATAIELIQVCIRQRQQHQKKRFEVTTNGKQLMKRTAEYKNKKKLIVFY